MKTPVKATLVTIAVVVVLVVAGLIYFLVNQSQSATPSSGDGAASPQVVRQSSHVLDDGGEGAVTLVEFLDFECEACGAFFPIVEDLREQFAGEITYVVRYFPLPGHFNSKNAAVAAEAAAQQDRFEDMYVRLFETQPEWGEAQESRADLFRGFAEEIGLDADMLQHTVEFYSEHASKGGGWRLDSLQAIALPHRVCHDINLTVPPRPKFTLPLPASHRGDFDEARRVLESAIERVEHLIAGVWHDTGAREEAVNVINGPSPTVDGGPGGRAITNLPDDALVEVGRALSATLPSSNVSKALGNVLLFAVPTVPRAQSVLPSSSSAATKAAVPSPST